MPPPNSPVLVGSVLFGMDKEIIDMVVARVPHLQGRPYDKVVALGVVSAGRIIGGTTYSNYRGHDIEFGGAFDSPMWCRYETLRTLFAYPFCQLKCERMTSVTGRKNKRARKILEHLGFRLEGVSRRGLDGKQDGMIYGMLKEECRWIR